MLARSILTRERINPQSWLNVLTPDVVDFYLVNQYLNFGTVLRPFTDPSTILDFDQIKLSLGEGPVSSHFSYDFNTQHLIVVAPNLLNTWTCWVYSTKDYQLIYSWSLECTTHEADFPNAQLTNQIVFIQLWNGCERKMYHYKLDGTMCDQTNTNLYRAEVFGSSPLIVDGQVYTSHELNLFQSARQLSIVQTCDANILLTFKVPVEQCVSPRIITMNLIDRALVICHTETSNLNLFNFSTGEKVTTVSSTEWRFRKVYIDDCRQLVIIASPVTNPGKLSLLIY